MQKRWLALVLLAAFGLAAACNSAELKGAASSGGTSSGGPEEEIPVDPIEGGRDPVADLDGGTIPTSTNVTIQVQPSDSGAQILSAIRGATKSVHMTMYLLTNDQIIDALGDLTAAGKDVKVVLNQSFPPNGGNNTVAFNKLKARNVPVVYAPAAYTFTHAKTVIIDGARVLIMTMNLTQTSARENREYIATDADPADVADAEKIFAADFAATALTVNGKLVVSPQAATPIDSRARLKSLIDGAKKTLDVEVQSLSDGALTDALILAHQDKVAVRVVIASGFEASPAQKDAVAKLKAHGVPIRAAASPYIHAKALVVDGTRVFVGSHNFTPTALFNNREVGVVTDSAIEAAKVSAAIDQDFASGVTP
ncbi:MAG: hypothetical protein KF819_24975 [Labilithrix sp.]|nr:hypothetical protein [Labilithrix sp.]